MKLLELETAAGGLKHGLLNRQSGVLTTEPHYGDGTVLKQDRNCTKYCISLNTLNRRLIFYGKNKCHSAYQSGRASFDMTCS